MCATLYDGNQGETSCDRYGDVATCWRRGDTIFYSAELHYILDAGWGAALKWSNKNIIILLFRVRNILYKEPSIY